MSLPELKVPPSARGGILAIGNFDGVHRGHQAMVKEVARIAEANGHASVIVTFAPHPITILKPTVDLPTLTSIGDRKRLLKSFGADEVVVLPTTAELLEMSPVEFFTDVILRRFEARGVVEGPDFRFGKNRSGDVTTLRMLCDQHKLSMHVIDVVESNGQVISSSQIRRLIQAGQIREANSSLGHNFCVSGTVSRGAKRGRTIGFPTANLTKVEAMLPLDGVYAGRCELNGRHHAVAVSIGPNPTFAEGDRKVECHVIGFNGDLYGIQMTVQLVARLRDVQAYSTTDALVAAISADVEECSRVVNTIME